MPVAVSRRRTPGHAQRVQVVFPSGSPAPGLMHDCALGAGVRVRVNAANPGQWHVIWVDAWNDHARPLLKALIGPGAVQEVDSRSASQAGSEPDLDWIDFDLPGQHPDGSGSATCGWGDRILKTHAGTVAAIDLSAAKPWLRVAAVDVLDRWLHLPLNQALVDAERGVARGYAATTLEPGRARNEVLAEALRLARTASWALVEYLGRLAHSPHPVPESLRKVLNDLIEGYHALAAELPEPDQQLRSVVKAGRGVLDRLPAGVDENRSPTRDDASCAQRAVLSESLVTDIISLIDPRQIPGRMLRLSREPTVGEVRMRLTRDGRDAVVVEAPAYEPGHGNLRGGSASQQLSVRLIDTVTGADVEGAVLTLEGGAEHTSPVFRAVVPLPRADLNRLRADVYDGTSDEPPASSDADPDLLSTRRTAVLLATWRQLAAAVRLGEFRANDITARVRAVSGDPKATADELAEGSEPVSAAAATRQAMTAGVGDLLVAEVDAASGLIVP